MKNVISVNAEKCIKCGACADVCPLKIISFEPGKNPKSVPWAAKVCIDCGHCVCVCPTGALDQRSMKTVDCATVDHELRLSPEQAGQFFKSRRSIRAYKKDPVDKGLLEKILDIARYAPTGHNIQPVNWRVVYDTDEVRKYRDGVLDWMRDSLETNPEMAKKFQFKGIIAGCEAGLDIIMREAPHLVIAHAPQEERTGEHSSRIAMAHLDLAAAAFGLGTCWAGFFDLACMMWTPLKEALDLPTGHKAHCSIMIGYPKYVYKRVPVRKAPYISWK